MSPIVVSDRMNDINNEYKKPINVNFDLKTCKNSAVNCQIRYVFSQKNQAITTCNSENDCNFDHDEN